ncbi:hypothetical protein BGZ93_010941 [Podila epicladia]|nr:hypothetical protein BGZ92_000096 [Podila epicladia]KAG0087470.1 hypothetical protein BGZ93_010941 [Podila epicladia]
MSKAPDHSTHTKEKTTMGAQPSPRTPLRSSINVLAQPQTPQGTSSTNKGTPSRSATSTPGTASTTCDPFESTTPNFKDSSMFKGTPSGRDYGVLEKTKTLEISIKQHLDIVSKLKEDIESRKKDAAIEQSQFEGRMLELQEALQDVKLKTKQSHQRILANNEELQRRKDLQMEQQDALEYKNLQMLKLHERMVEMEQEKEQIRELQRDTDREKIEELQAEKAKLQKELAESHDVLRECMICNDQLEQTYRPEAIERLKEIFAQREEKVLQLENSLAEKKMITQRDPEDLLIVSKLAADRKIKILQEEYDQERKYASENERRKESETEAALEEYILKSQISVEIEEKTSEAEFNLLKDREELEKFHSARQHRSHQF